MSGVVDAPPLIPKAFRWTSLAPPACLLSAAAAIAMHDTWCRGYYCFVISIEISNQLLLQVGIYTYLVNIV